MPERKSVFILAAANPQPRPTIDRTRWQQLSALLDDALALDDHARAAWLAALRGRDAALADELAGLLGGATEIDQATRPDPFVRSEASAAPITTPDFAQLLGHALAQADDSAARPGQRLGAWRLLEKIGSGGMGQVWLAQRDDGLYDAQAAIKLLRSDLDTARLAQRFARERALLARLDHPAVARLLDAGIGTREEGGQAFLVLEFVAGQPLAAHARAACPLVAQRVALLLQVAQAVDHAHARLIVHRDLKPSNVMVTSQGQAKLLDFGIAALLEDAQHGESDLTRQTGRGLTLGYAAPEQVLGGPIGTAADVFSLGVMLFELLSGELPFGPRQAPRLAAEHALLHGEPKRLADVLAQPLAANAPGDEPGAHVGNQADASPGRPQDAHRALGDLEAVVAKALRKDPAQRYGSVQAFIDDLQRWQRLRPVSVRRDDRRHRTRLWLRRNAKLAAAGSAVVLSLAAGLALATWQWQRAQQAAWQSDQIAGYLTELLASASPEEHGGHMPTVLQVLQTSLKTLPGRFQNDPDTRIRLLEVLSDTYHGLGRYDLAQPLFDELVALSTQRLGAHHATTLKANWQRARAYQIQGQCDKAVAALERLDEALQRVFGPASEEVRLRLYILNSCYARLGRINDAEAVLMRAGELTEAQFAPGTLQWLSHQNHVQVLRNSQGRFTEGLQAIMKTQPWWGSTDPALQVELLVYRRNAAIMQMRLSQYDGLDERVQAVVDSFTRVLGPAGEAGLGLLAEWAQSQTDRGQHLRALALRDDALARARSAGVHNPAQWLPLQAQRLLAATQAGAEPAAALLGEARTLLAQTVADRQALGYPRAEAWLALARAGLSLSDTTLAQQALDTLSTDTGLDLPRNALLASRLALAQGQLARLKGDLAASQALLQQRLDWFLARPSADIQVLPVWGAALEVACGLALQASAQAASAGETSEAAAATATAAAAALNAAAAYRPLGLGAGHPLDRAVQALQAASTSAQAQAAARALAAALL
jgi:eukaryotic-like serine/threonine-protein kinase